MNAAEGFVVPAGGKRLQSPAIFRLGAWAVVAVEGNDDRQGVDLRRSRGCGHGPPCTPRNLYPRRAPAA